ncbi:cytochrome P450 [Parachaetomium inaequale]|uniref:Cytochrome P450 n=1 Tax=Parachaetomium inaequale TaxID=2588326 RepID=A0AAN6P8N9_9PEZI|nr:cytochrome P450 [Parachaetomium inaequale]
MAAFGANLLALLQLSAYLAWPLITVILASLLAISYALYNLFFHPLRPVPGPKLWAATQIPYTLTWLSGRLHIIVHELHEKHGDVVRIAPNRLSFTHPDAWQRIRGHRKSGQGEHGKDSTFYFTNKNNILGASRDDHSRYRRILAHAFSAKSMQDQQPLIMQYVDLLMQQLSERTEDENGRPREAVVNLAAWFNFATFDVIGDLAFGEPFGCLQESRYHPWVEAIFHGVEQFGVMIALRMYSPGLVGIAKRLGFIGSTELQVAYARERITRRLALETGRPDFVEAMAMVKPGNGQALTMEEMASNARMLVLAGSETTATALSGAAYFLARHPETQRRLEAEVRSSFASEEEIDLFSVNKLRYMLAVLDEAMRMFPPVPTQLPRACQPGGDVICGYQVPGGTGLDIFPWAMNYSSRNFTQPNEFIPERWLDGDDYSGQQLNKQRHNALQPFSVGPRNCIGKNLAYVEMRLILARLIWNYNLVLGDQASESFLACKSFNLWMKGPLNIRLIPVKE